MHTAHFSNTTAHIPVNGRGSTAAARTITNGAIAAATATSVTVTNAAGTSAVGDMIFCGTQGIWGTITAINSNTFSVKRWYRLGGGADVVPAVSGSITVWPGGILRSARATKITGHSAGSTNVLTITDCAGNTVTTVQARMNVPLKVYGPWIASAGTAANVTLHFELIGELDT